MKDTRTNRTEREQEIIKCLRKLAEIHKVLAWEYRIETWTKYDVNLKLDDKLT